MNKILIYGLVALGLVLIGFGLGYVFQMNIIAQLKETINLLENIPFECSCFC